jgi:hypothetical protein
MWTATITGKTFKGGVLIVNCEFSNETSTVSKSFDGVTNLESLKSVVRSHLDILTNLETFSGTLPIGLFDSTATVPTVSQTEVDRNDWLKDYYKWVMVKKNLIDTGILTGNETAVVNLKTKVQSGFKASYLDSI